MTETADVASEGGLFPINAVHAKDSIAVSARERREFGLLPLPAKRGEGTGRSAVDSMSPITRCLNRASPPMP
jgi:hypothetical protein